jgi:hypothetical protein
MGYRIWNPRTNFEDSRRLAQPGTKLRTQFRNRVAIEDASNKSENAGSFDRVAGATAILSKKQAPKIPYANSLHAQGWTRLQIFTKHIRV